jgi:uncharacterized protein (TIGR03083 family)
MDPWDKISADRRAFADYLESLAPDDWNKPSLCEGWTVKGVTTHLLVTPTQSKGQVMLAFIGSGFSLPKLSAKLIDKMTAELSTDDIIAKTRETADSQNKPPGLTSMGVLGEVLVHTADVSLAVGKPFDLPVDHYTAGLDYLKTVQPVLGCKKRIEGLRLEATDADWSTGEGPSVTGTAKHLLSAMTGRKAALDHLSGDGVDVLRAR